MFQPVSEHLVRRWCLRPQATFRLGTDVLRVRMNQFIVRVLAA